MRKLKNCKYLAWLFVLTLVFSLVFGGICAEVMAKGSKVNTIKAVSLKIGNKEVAKKTSLQHFLNKREEAIQG